MSGNCEPEWTKAIASYRRSGQKRAVFFCDLLGENEKESFILTAFSYECRSRQIFFNATYGGLTRKFIFSCNFSKKKLGVKLYPPPMLLEWHSIAQPAKSNVWDWEEDVLSRHLVINRFEVNSLF